MHNHEHSERLASFADVLAGELPGFWTSTHYPPDAKDDLVDLADRVWDLDLVAASLAEHPLQEASVLSRPDGARLVVLDRHDGRDGFLAAALAPHALPDEAYRAVPEPNGIALPDDPFHSAEQICGDLLPRYDSALAQARHHAMASVQPSQPDRLVLTWQPDNSITAVPVGPAARAVLAGNGFEHDPHTGIHRLTADDTRSQAHALRAIGPQLDALGIGTVLQHPQGRNTPTAAPAPAPAPASTRAQAGRTR